MAMLALAGCASMPQGPGEFTVLNGTGYTLVEVFVSPSADDGWGNDLLAERPLPNGESVVLPAPGMGMYSLFAVDEGGDFYFVWNVPIVPGASVEIAFTNLDWERWQAPSLEPRPGMPRIVVVNETGAIFFNLRLKPFVFEEWSADLLRGQGPLQNGLEIGVTLPFALTTITRYDVLLIATDGTPYVKRNIVVSDGGRVVLTPADIDTGMIR